ncbi:MAG: hypothetical protein J6Q48_04580 [Bacteroidaceae bacterium]|nr:hypothetical protein [Bacteroidaceae bacterium]
MTYQKFVITDEGELRFGKVYHHRNLLRWGESCPNGGGLWRVDEERGAVVLYGRSFEFGTPEFGNLKYVNWDGIDGMERPIFYQPHWPYDETLVPVGLL